MCQNLDCKTEMRRFSAVRTGELTHDDIYTNEPRHGKTCFAICEQ